MMELGRMQKLAVVDEEQRGLSLAGGVLLPRQQAPRDLAIGDEIEVFVYQDPAAGLVATPARPKLLLGELAMLKVVDTTKFGAFLDWGLEKDLLLPHKEQVGRVVEGRSYLVGLFVNARGRLTATMRVYDLLQADAPYKKDDRVQGVIYSINRELGAFVAVDNKYHGLIANNELFGSHAVGDQVTVRVKQVRPDGKLDLSLREAAHHEIEHDAQKIMDKLQLNGGVLPLNDYSPPEEINAQLAMSKRAFKRAVGRLLLQGAITITDKGIQVRDGS
ncbi:MAG: S1 RNA-binding domain-containing protein [Peptococcaceae bacterium]|nr:S1 RNA-binding domain-containing protein [Candidatus Syntrophopropionicum ammoniitolerans]